jgi:ubiquinone/menaquinone biosynthesis C-methylase UbiE
MTRDADKLFAGSIPRTYDEVLVPLFFQPYADDLAKRLSSRRVTRVLEVGCGTGAVTRALVAALPAGAEIVATDLNPAMLERAKAVTDAGSRRIEWHPADAMSLPVADQTFDAVACQFAAMFFPDKPRAFGELRRVLKPGGVFLFSVWDRIENNEFADVVTAALVERFPEHPPRFLARTPHGYFDTAVLAADLRAGGFAAKPAIETVAFRSRASSAREAAIACVHGTPMRNEIEPIGGPAALAEAAEVAEAALAARFGPGPIDGKIQAHVITVER